ncbi:serine/threonine-protein kinase [Piscinibacter sp. XHJ-5]|uniref:serine/threonine-protein kinase n=1 Tax=Piscinibacter sp. XHJ-5 TaxID=3037797 RepID=UPI0024532555|nr:serine/threonine-protein kinase [Piscinibacter sp. XHJ-5]
MALSEADLRQLARLIDDAMALPVAQREAWMAALPPADQPLVARLRLALSQDEGTSTAPNLNLPTLGPLDRDASKGDFLGPYRLIEEIGRGGMGCVWRAERADGIFKREVAVKLPRLSRGDSLVQRMVSEREIGARLEHPHIARLYDAGVAQNGRPYLVMEWVHGMHLDAYADRLRLTIPQRMELMLQVCAAVAHAHRHLVVHRDLKPSNILVDESGQVKLLDFGVARLLQDEGGSPSAVLGGAQLTRTPQYAAPEQFFGGPISTLTDVYSLGVVLYELLTGVLPAARREAAVGASALVYSDFAPTPASRARFTRDNALARGKRDIAALRRALTPEVDAVVLRALQPDPQARHASVDKLADDLQAILDARLPSSAPKSAWRRMRLFVARHQWAVAAVTVGIAALGVTGTLAWMERSNALAQESRLSQVRLFMLTTFTDAEPPTGHVADSLTGIQMIESALQRARSSFADEPSLRAEVFSEIAIMLRRFARSREALALLREAHALMQVHAPPRDPGRHIVAAQLATDELNDFLRSGNPTSLAAVRPLASQALAACSADTRRCAKARAAANIALRNLASYEGDMESAIASGRAAVRESDLGFGHPHSEGTMARVHLAIVLRNADRLQEADALLSEAVAAARTALLRRGDAVELRTSQAVIQGDLGQHAEALRTLQGLLGELKPDAPAAALLHRLRAQSQLALGLLPDALRSTEQALEVATQRQDTWEAVNAHGVRTRALAAMGLQELSQAEWLSWRAAVDKLGGPITALQPARLRRAEAELALRAGLVEQARTLLIPLTKADPRTERASPVEIALHWELRAAIERRDHLLDAAIAAHERAAELLARTLPASHPLRLRNALEQALANTLRHGAAGAEPLRQAAQRYLEGLPAESAWRPLVQRLLTEPEAGISMVL